MFENLNQTNYQAFFNKKLEKIREKFSEFNTLKFEAHESIIKNFRMRAEFRIWHINNKFEYIMFEPDTKSKIPLSQLPIASKKINQLMPLLQNLICNTPILKDRLFQIEFLTSRNQEALVTLIYKRCLNNDWTDAASKLEKKLKINIIGRSRKQKIVLSKDFIIESFTVKHQKYFYKQIENTFSQPNAFINEKMLNWTLQICQKLSEDLVELFCGNGNFTCVIASCFNKVFATEISKTSIKSAYYNFQKNSIHNVFIARLASHEVSQALKNTRKFYRLREINLHDYNFSTIFVDPPRAGLDQETRFLAKEFNHLIYISCNPVTLKSDLKFLEKTHQVMQIAIFDQFPYTNHIEMGVYLKKR